MRFTTATALRLSLATALSLSALGPLGPVLAQDSAQPGAGMRGPMSFTELDRNDDGIVTEEELNQARSERRAARSEAGAPMRGMPNAPSFSDIDQNGDGQLTIEEFADFRAQRMGSGAMRPGSGMGAAGMGGAGRGPGMGRMGGQMPTFSSFDADGDGLISKDELEKGRAERIKERSQQGYQMRNLANAPSFEAIDQDGDGQIDEQEFQSAQMQHRRMMQP
ncbi:EF-hand domain-containing protein [Halochromatium sp.]